MHGRGLQTLGDQYVLLLRTIAARRVKSGFALARLPLQSGPHFFGSAAGGRQFF
jgi:hypothetical protein